MITIETFRITGISPLLMHNPAGMSASSDAITMGKKIPTPEEEAEAGCYRDEDGAFYLPSIQFRASLLRGCTGRKLGKRAAATMVAAGVFNVDTRCRLFDPATGALLSVYKINAMRAVIKSVGKSNGVIRCRPEVWPWAADVVFEIDDDFVTVGHIVELLSYAGRIAGVGDYRPEKKGPYGRYRAEHRAAQQSPALAAE